MDPIIWVMINRRNILLDSTPARFMGCLGFSMTANACIEISALAASRRDRCRTYRFPTATFPARNAPMAVAFMPQDTADPKLSCDAVVALHGSWATRPSGGIFGDKSTRRAPKIVAVRFSEGTAQRVDDLITGFQLPDGDRWARPVGVAVGEDGTLYFSSDSGVNALFRLRLTE
jgi:glucose/arabinose dehydrogenase